MSWVWLEVLDFVTVCQVEQHAPRPLPVWCPGVLLVAACSPLLKDGDGRPGTGGPENQCEGQTRSLIGRLTFLKQRCRDGSSGLASAGVTAASSSSRLSFSSSMAGRPPTAQLDPRIGLGLFAASQTQSLTPFPFSCFPAWVAPWHSWSTFTHKQCSSYISPPTVDLFTRKSADITNHTKAIYPPPVGKISFLCVSL